MELLAAMGELSLWLALLLSAWAAVSALTARRHLAGPLMLSARRALATVAALAALAVAALMAALLRQDFSFAIVAATTHLDLAPIFRLTALWSGPRGGTVLWALAVCVASWLAVRQASGRGHAALPGLTATLAVVATFFLAVAAIYARPFSRLEWPLAEGLGMPLELQHLGAAFEPVLLTSGMAALLTGLVVIGVEFVVSRYRGIAPVYLALPWMAGAWLLISAGLLVEAWSTFAELGWGEYSRRTQIGAVIAVPWTVAGGSVILLARREGPIWRAMLRNALLPMAAGVMLLVAGLVAFAFRRDEGFVLTGGQVENVVDSFGRSWTISSLGISTDRRDSDDAVSVALELRDPGGSTRLLRTDRVTQRSTRGDEIGTPVTVPAVHSSLAGDLLAAVDDVIDERALVRVRYVPLSALVWAGGLLILVAQLSGLLLSLRHGDRDD
jgi:cytochrome c biogenesis factor